MMLAMLAAAAMFTTLPRVDEQDVRCLAFLSRAAGKVEGEQRRRVEGGAIWYFGRLAARSPAVDALDQVARVLAAPSYDGAAYDADKQRCHAELQSLVTSYGTWVSTYQAAGSMPDKPDGK